MDTDSSGPDEVPFGEQTDIEAPPPAESAETPGTDDAAYNEVETNPLGGTGGVSSGGAG